MGERLYSLVVKQRGRWVHLGVTMVAGGSLDVDLMVHRLGGLPGEERKYTTHANGLITLSEAKDPVAQARVHSYFWSDSEVRGLLPRNVLVILVCNALIACDL
jgi:hypothetical protein